jgi:hypothetical protein
MTTAIDTNVLVALWDKDDALNSVAQAALDAAFAQGKILLTLWMTACIEPPFPNFGSSKCNPGHYSLKSKVKN